MRWGMHASTALSHPTPTTRSAERRSPEQPLSVALLSIDDGPHLRDELLFEALLFQRGPHLKVWRQGESVAVLRASDELDTVLWAEQVRERLHEVGLRLSAAVASANATDGRGPKPAALILAEAERTLDEVRRHGGDMVLAHSTTQAVRRR